MEGIHMPGDPVHDRVAAAIQAISGLVTSPPNLGFDFADLRAGLIDGGRAVFGEGEASGPDRAIKAAEAAFADLKRAIREGDLPLALPARDYGMRSWPKR
jgi:hypothetical protein